MPRKESKKQSAAKQPKKRASKPRTKATAPGAAAVQAATATTDKRTANQVRQGFLDHRRAWIAWQAKVKVVEKLGTDVKAALKADGYKVIQMQIADDLAGSAKAEAKVQSAVTDRLQVARWIGHPMGAQLDLFAQPDRTPAVDRAYDAGVQASMENKPLKPPCAPETEQYRQFTEGWHAHQAELSKGFKRQNGDAAAPAANGSGPAPEPDLVSDPVSGEHISRSEWKRRMAATTAQDADGAPAQTH